MKHVFLLPIKSILLISRNTGVPEWRTMFRTSLSESSHFFCLANFHHHLAAERVFVTVNTRRVDQHDLPGAAKGSENGLYVFHFISQS
jgi:hypothetical protein